MSENKGEETPKKDKISPIPLQKEMKDCYLDYAMSVIVGRALPDVRDGMKPVHRRALYSMHTSSSAVLRTPFKRFNGFLGMINSAVSLAVISVRVYLTSLCASVATKVRFSVGFIILHKISDNRIKICINTIHPFL